MPCALAPGRTLRVLVVSGGETLVLEVKSPCRRAPLRQLKLHLSPIVLGVVLVGALHETGGADGVGHVAVVVPTARVPGVSFRVDQDGRQLRARQVLLVPVHVADAEERRLVAHRCSRGTPGRRQASSAPLEALVLAKPRSGSFLLRGTGGSPPYGGLAPERGCLALRELPLLLTVGFHVDLVVLGGENLVLMARPPCRRAPPG